MLWCPDWPVVTALREAKRHPSLPAAVFTANRVQACTAAARAEGIEVGQRRRDAQARCPELLVFKADPERDARDFEAIAALVELLAPGLEVLRPGLIACPVRGPARYFRSETRAAEKLVDTVEALDVECRIGIADSLEVAVLAARLGRLVPAGESTGFCAPLPIGLLAVEPAIAGEDRPALVDLLVRLGISTLGAYATLPDAKVATRFGADGILAHRLAKGLGERTVSRRSIPPDLAVRQACDPPLDRVDTAAFAARALAEKFHQRLADAGLACTRLSITATTDLGKELSRTWRCAAPLTPSATADRLRWQLDGWLSASRLRSGRTTGSATIGDDAESAAERGAAGAEVGAITSLTLEPVEALDAGQIQFGLWGSEGEDDSRAGWALSRIQGLLGPESVMSPVLSGGRSPQQRAVLLPWGQERTVSRDPAAPWPGVIPAPSPTRTPPLSRQSPVAGTAALLDSRGHDIVVTDRGVLSSRPHWFVTQAPVPEERPRPPATAMTAVQPAPLARPRVPARSAASAGSRSSTRPSRTRVVGWGGPWILDEHWWDGTGRPRARIQLELPDSAPLLLGYDADGWSVEGVYD